MQTDIQACVLFIGEMTSNEPQCLRRRAQSIFTQRRQMFLSKGSQLSSHKPKCISICSIKPFEGILGARRPCEMAAREEMRWGYCKTQQSCVRRGNIQLCEASEGWGAQQELGSAGTPIPRLFSLLARPRINFSSFASGAAPCPPSS